MHRATWASLLPTTAALPYHRSTTNSAPKQVTGGSGFKSAALFVFLASTISDNLRHSKLTICACLCFPPGAKHSSLCPFCPLLGRKTLSARVCPFSDFGLRSATTLSGNERSQITSHFGDTECAKIKINIQTRVSH